MERATNFLRRPTILAGLRVLVKWAPRVGVDGGLDEGISVRILARDSVLKVGTTSVRVEFLLPLGAAGTIAIIVAVIDSAIGRHGSGAVAVNVDYGGCANAKKKAADADKNIRQGIQRGWAHFIRGMQRCI